MLASKCRTGQSACVGIGGSEERCCERRGNLRARVLLAAGLSTVLLCSCNPAIARSKGVVTSVRKKTEQTAEVCLRDTTDAGSTYGSNRDRDSICWDGVLEGVEPTIGACVVLQAQGESSVLRVESAEGCR